LTAQRRVRRKAPFSDGNYLGECSNRAEVSYGILDECRNHGIGTFMFKHLVKIAKAGGISGFTADVL